MKGVVLAGGLGTRLAPLTNITNKHLLPVYNRAMVTYPIQTLVDAGIEDILLVTGGTHYGQFVQLLQNGEEFGLRRLHYAYQKGEGGIADALSLAEPFAEGGKIVVMLGDNIIEDSILDAVNRFRKQESGAKIFLKEVPKPEEFGVAEVKNDRIISITEKPEKPISNLAVVGIYMYDNAVFDIIRTLKPSKRGEFEITDVNNAYVARGDITYEILEGYWGDAGESIDSLISVSLYVARKQGFPE
ncbi:MAG: sugar phosphate nucleotidyltransferase [Planctomycetota bacterium]|jgi:glucose-1-phosphate thymidylyltransferase